MGSLKKVTILSILVVFLQSCASTSGYPDPSEPKLKDDPKSVYLFSQSDRDGASTKALRNILIDKKKAQIDAAYGQFERGMYKENVVLNLSSDMGLLALSGVGVLTGSTKEKEILAAISAFVLGGRSAFEQRVLFESTMSVIAQTMRADRIRIETHILQNTDKSLKEYPISAAASDVARYYFAGSIPGALTSLAKTASKEEVEASEERAEVLRIRFESDNATACLQKYQTTNDKRDATKVKDVQTWLSSSKYVAMSMNSLMFGSSQADRAARVEAVKHLEVNKGLVCDD